MTELRYYENLKEYKKAKKPLEALLVLIFFEILNIVIGILIVCKIAEIINEIQNHYSYIFFSIVICCINGYCIIYFLNNLSDGDYKDFCFSFNIEKLFIEYKNERDEIIKKNGYKFSVRTYYGKEFLCKDFISCPDGTVSMPKDEKVWDENDTEQNHYSLIISLEDNHILTIDEIKAHSDERKEMKVQRDKLIEQAGQDLSNFSLEELKDLEKKYCMYSIDYNNTEKILYLELEQEAERIRFEINSRCEQKGKI
ncbi:MAG: hypothetical protein K5751_07925 [Treponemataceae bacterium]|nr:hypothetical protein [Treponemataceae bacterium]